MKEDIRRIFACNARIQQESLAYLEESIAAAAQRLSDCLLAGGKILLCGNGGSAADAQHFAAELINRFSLDRAPLPAIALTTDSSVLTSIANDYAFEEVFAKQIEALATAQDILILITTSGNSQSLLGALRTAQRKKMKVLLLNGKDGGAIVKLLDERCLELRVPAQDTPRIQEIHILIIHCLCHLIEKRIFTAA